MKEIINACINGNFDKKYIIPFFWQHGENHKALEEEIDAIKNSSINSFCVESRVHNDFCKKKWWEDFGFILKEAEKRNMKVWLLDDKNFPTGYANNYIEKHPELKKISLRVEYRDFFGPLKDCTAIVPKLDEGEAFVSVAAFERKSGNDILSGNPINLTDKIQNKMIYFDIPDGVWRLYYVIKTRKSVPGRENYIDMLNTKSCEAMIKAIYQPHYEHFKEYFGNTFAGFFSDEPGFANDSDSYDSKLGKPNMLIPWNDNLPKIMSENSEMSETDITLYLASLWHDTDKTSEIRQLYMDSVSKELSKNFSCRIGDWCREHNVMYIGHIIEDMNTHMRIGYGCGHYFRALDGQDMAGIDVVLHQIIPGMNELNHTAAVFDNITDTVFYNYALAKLASSHAHLQQLKQNRAMCEIFGAYGWAEGLPMQKRLIDHMLVRGINYFVPHAFNPKYPDDDCPPHFYAGGNNTQYKLFSSLMNYTQKACYLLSTGEITAKVAVLYNAEAEWSNGKFSFFQDTAKLLMQNQIDFDIVYEDVLYNANISDNQLKINNRKYDIIIVSYSEILPYKLLKTLDYLSDRGIKVIFTDCITKKSSENIKTDDLLKKCEVVGSENLISYLKKNGFYDIYTDGEKNLRYIHNKFKSGDVYMLVNEDSFNTADTYVDFNSTECVFYDLWNNELSMPEIKDSKVHVRLMPGESVFLICSSCSYSDNLPLYRYDYSAVAATLKYNVYIKKAERKKFKFYCTTNKLFNITGKDFLPEFFGTIKYETEFEIENEDSLYGISFGKVGETASVWLNGKYLGSKIGIPYIFEFKDALKQGKNKLKIEIINNPAYKERDFFSTYIQLAPSGIIGPVEFIL